MKMRHIMSKVKQKQASGKVIPIYQFLLNFPLYDSLVITQTEIVQKTC